MSDRLTAACGFMAAHARLLDRRRFELLFEGGDAESVLAALRAIALATAATVTVRSPTRARPRASRRRRGMRSRSSRTSPR